MATDPEFEKTGVKKGPVASGNPDPPGLRRTTRVVMGPSAAEFFGDDTPPPPPPPGGEEDSPFFDTGAPGSPDNPISVSIADTTQQAWSSFDPAGWTNVSRTTKAAFGFPTVTTFKTRANAAAQLFFDRNGRWPSASELLADQTFTGYMSNLAAGYPYLPPYFAVDGQTYINDPFEGPAVFSLQGDINKTLGPGGIDAALNAGVLNNSGQLQQPANASWSMEQFQTLMQQLSPARGGRGGGGGRRGGGGAGRAARVFDRDQLVEAATDRWKGLLYDDPTDDQIATLVDSYINRSQAFWMGQGGNLDYDTYIVNKMREEKRYKTLYNRKDPQLTEEEWMARYRPAVEQFGLNATATKREVEAGLTSGAGQTGFTERVSRTREARLASGGSFSRRLAGGMAQMGRMG